MFHIDCRTLNPVLAINNDHNTDLQIRDMSLTFIVMILILLQSREISILHFTLFSFTADYMQEDI